MEIAKPDYTYLWSSGGSIVAPSNVKIQTGWTAEVPPFQWENWSQNRQDQAIAHVLQHGISVWDAVTEYQAGKSYVQGSDGLLYKALQTHDGQNPVTDVTFVYWAKALSGGLLNTRVFTSTAVYTPTPGTKSVDVLVLGGGGGGGGVLAQNSVNAAAGGGGGGGGGARSYLITGFDGVTMTVGAGGAGGVSSGAPGSGTASSFGSLLSATGGAAGTSSVGALPGYSLIGGSGGSGSLGNIYNSRGHAGDMGIVLQTANLIGGSGGSSVLGAGGPRTTANQAGVSATVYGGGGSGASCPADGTSQNGGAGAGGVIIVMEYN